MRTKVPKRVRRRLYRTWARMVQRCTNPADRAYHNYGGRGIKVCSEWEASSVPFIEWALANGFREDLEIDRIDNDGDYSPENCQWVTHKQNMNNTRRSRLMSGFGEIKTVALWAEDPRCTVDRNCLEDRVRKGWDIETALTAPPFSRPYGRSPSGTRREMQLTTSSRL